MKRASELDKAFLFLLATVGFTFGALNAGFGGPTGILLFVPLLASGLFLPFYMGFIRGAVKSDCNVARVEGWVYFIVAIANYAWMIGFVIFRVQLASFVYLAFLIASAIFGGGLVLSLLLARWTMKILVLKSTKRLWVIVLGHAFVAMAFSAAIFFLVLMIPPVGMLSSNPLGELPYFLGNLIAALVASVLLRKYEGEIG